MRWVRTLVANAATLKADDFRSDATVIGRFWSARKDGEGVGELAVEHLRLDPQAYPIGAIRFMLPKEAASLPDLRRPTAFDGMLFPKWAAPESHLLKWGIVPPVAGLKSGIREGVTKKKVPIKETGRPIFVPAG